MEDPMENTRPETKQETWVRVTNQRIAKAVERLRLMHALGNKNNYAYTQEQAIAVVDILRKEVLAVETALLGEKEQAMMPQISLDESANDADT